MSYLKHVFGLCLTLEPQDSSSPSSTPRAQSCSVSSKASCMVDLAQSHAALPPVSPVNPERPLSAIPAQNRQSFDALLSIVSITAAAATGPSEALTQPLPNTTDLARQLREASYHSLLRSITSNPADRENFNMHPDTAAPLASGSLGKSLSPGPSQDAAHGDRTRRGVTRPAPSPAHARLLATIPNSQYHHHHHHHQQQQQKAEAQAGRCAGTTAGMSYTDAAAARQVSLTADLRLPALQQRQDVYVYPLDEFQAVQRPATVRPATGLGFDDMTTLDLTLDLSVATPTALLWTDAEGDMGEQSGGTLEVRPQEHMRGGSWWSQPLQSSQPSVVSRPPAVLQQTASQPEPHQQQGQLRAASQAGCMGLTPRPGSEGGESAHASTGTPRTALEADLLMNSGAYCNVAKREADGRQSPTMKAPEAGVPQPEPELQYRNVLNLSQVGDCVTELRVLHIRPGAALLIGKATTSGSHVMARFERGRPGLLLAPRLLSLLQDRGTLSHPNVAATLGIYTVALPSHVFNPPPAPGSSPWLSLAPSFGLRDGCGSEVGPRMGSGTPGTGMGLDPRQGLRTMPPLAAPSASDSPMGHPADESNNSFMAGLDFDRIDSGWPSSLANVRDMATATLALQHAEAVRGASNGSGVIGSAVHSTGTSLSRSTRLLHAMVGPQVRLRDVVGHLRGTGGRSSGEGRGGSTGFLSGGNQRDRIRMVPSDGAAAVAAAATAAAAAGGSNPPKASPIAGAVVGSSAIAFVTLTLSELCEGSNLYDEARRGVFACCFPEPLPPPPPSSSSSLSSSPAPSNRPWSDRVYGNQDLVQRIERFVCTASELAKGLLFLHIECGLAHGDLVSRNVLLQRRTNTGTGPKVGCGGLAGGRAGSAATGGNAGGGASSVYIVKVIGYGRLAATPPAPPEGDADTSPSVEGLRGGGAGAFLQLSTTSLTRINTVHVGLWRDVHSLAPERLTDPEAPPSFEADVYAYGSILYEMAVGESPWSGMTSACVAVGAATGDLRISCPSIALPSIAKLIERCTAQLPVDRPSMEEVIAALGSIREEIAAGRELQLVRQQQQDARYIMKTFLETDSDVGSSTNTWVTKD